MFINNCNCINKNAQSCTSSDAHILTLDTSVFTFNTTHICGVSLSTRCGHGKLQFVDGQLSFGKNFCFQELWVCRRQTERLIRLFGLYVRSFRTP